MKKYMILCVVLCGFMPIHLAAESIEFDVDFSLSQCLVKATGIACEQQSLSQNKVSVGFDNCTSKDGYETCTATWYGSQVQDANYGFFAKVTVTKFGFQSRIPEYSLTAELSRARNSPAFLSTTITLRNGPILTDKISLKGPMIWYKKDEGYYQPFLSIGSDWDRPIIED